MSYDPNDLQLDPQAELAYRRAGVPIDTALGRAFARSYDGSAGWDADDLQSAYNQLASEVGAPATADDREMQEHRQALREGAVGDTGVKDRRTTRREIRERHLDAVEHGGRRREDAMGDFFGDLVGHAIETGDGIITEG
jgi:hypothetical protein